MPPLQPGKAAPILIDRNEPAEDCRKQSRANIAKRALRVAAIKRSERAAARAQMQSAEAT